MLRTGAPWRDVPGRFGRWTTIYSRFRRWTTRGVWQRIFEALLRQADQEGRLDWSKHVVDGTIVRAHVSAAGAKGGHQREALGRCRGGFSTKIHLRAEGNGKPFAFVLSGGERHEAAFFNDLVQQGAVRRAGRGRPRTRPGTLVGDRGYSYDRIRRFLWRRGIRVVIPRRRDQRPGLDFDSTTYRERNRVERLVGQLKRFRRVATRYEKRAASYLGLLTVVAILLWVK